MNDYKYRKIKVKIETEDIIKEFEYDDSEYILEIKRLNNIIEEFEKWITFSDTESFNPALNYDDECKMEYIYVDDLLDKLKELKEGK